MPTCTVVGIINDWKFEMRDVRLLPGDALVLYTDGVTEAASDDGEEFGEERLVHLLRTHASLPAPSQPCVIESPMNAISHGPAFVFARSSTTSVLAMAR